MKKSIAQQVFGNEVFVRGYKPVRLHYVEAETISVMNICKMIFEKIKKDGKLLGPSTEIMWHI